MELSRKDFEEKAAKKKSRTWIYLIAVAVAFFLLIFFFALTTALSKPQSMDLKLAVESQKETTIDPKIAARSITIVVGDNNKIICYVGPLSSPLEKPKEFEFGKDGIRKELLRLKSTLSKEGKDNRIVIIKVSKKSSYKNMVDILDEMAISNVPTYALVDITPEDEKLLEKK